MTPIEIESKLSAILLERQSACAEKSASLPPDAIHEKKALAVEGGMYSLCLRAGLLYAPGSDRAAAIRQKAGRMPRVSRPYPAVTAALCTADTEEKDALAAALYGELWISSEILPRYRTEWEAAQTTGSVEAVFEARIKLEVIEWVLAKWRHLRRTGGIYPTLPGEATV